jgi:hypothetical protein
MDNQWIASWRQWLGVLSFRIYLKSLFGRAFVPGFRQAKFAAKLGFRGQHVIEGHYACDIEGHYACDLQGIGNLPAQLSESKSFLFIGRLVEEKGD